MNWKKTNYIPHPKVDAGSVAAIGIRDTMTGEVVVLARDQSRKDLDLLFAEFLTLLRLRQQAYPDMECFVGATGDCKPPRKRHMRKKRR